MQAEGRGRYTRKLKLINIPVLKHHDVGGSEVTAALKNTYDVWRGESEWRLQLAAARLSASARSSSPRWA